MSGKLTKDIQPAYTCPICGRCSYHPKDIEQRYCGNCLMSEDERADRFATVALAATGRGPLTDVEVREDMDRLITRPDYAP